MNYKKLTYILTVVAVVCGMLGAYVVNADYGYLGYFNLNCNGQTGDICFGTDKFNFDYSSGYVGIGDNTPTAPLELAHPTANELAIFRSGDDGGRIKVSDDDTDNYVISQNGYMSLGGVNSLNAGNLNIESSTGNVGIGTNNPSYILDINTKAGGNDGLFLNNNAGDLRVLLFNEVDDGRLNLYDTTDSKTVQLHSDDDSYITGGYFGIGTNSPSQLLDLSGGNMLLDDDATIVWGDGASRPYIIANNVADTFSINNANVGIETTTPGYQLEVNGDLQADDYYSGDGTQGMTGSCGSGTTLTVKDGLITACS